MNSSGTKLCTSLRAHTCSIPPLMPHPTFMTTHCSSTSPRQRMGAGTHIHRSLRPPGSVTQCMARTISSWLGLQRSGGTHGIPKWVSQQAASINMYTAPHTCSQHALPHLTCDQQPFLSTSTSSFNSFWPERGCFLALTYLSSTTGRPICTMNATCPTRCGSRRLSLRATSAIHFLRYARACDIRCVSSLHCPGTV